MSDFFKGLVQHKQNMELIKGLQDLTASEAIAEDALKEIASLRQQLAEAQTKVQEAEKEIERLQDQLVQALNGEDY